MGRRTTFFFSGYGGCAGDDDASHWCQCLEKYTASKPKQRAVHQVQNATVFKNNSAIEKFLYKLEITPTKQ